VPPAARTNPFTSLNKPYRLNISVGSKCLDTEITSLTNVGNTEAPLSKSIYLYIPAYTFNPTFEQAYLSSPIKQIKYTDIYQYQVLGTQAGQQINSLLTNGIQNVHFVKQQQYTYGMIVKRNLVHHELRTKKRYEYIPIEHDNCPRRGDVTGPIVLIPSLPLEELLEGFNEGKGSYHAWKLQWHGSTIRFVQEFIDQPVYGCPAPRPALAAKNLNKWLDELDPRCPRNIPAKLCFTKLCKPNTIKTACWWSGFISSPGTT
jgi:hypothetical protein